MHHNVRAGSMAAVWLGQALIGLILPVSLSIGAISLIDHTVAASGQNSPSQDDTLLATPTARPPNPSLEDFWNNTAAWALETHDTGLPVGESDTIYMGNGEYWSYLHASTQSAGVVDSCGNFVSFPGCVMRWVSTNGGESFTLPEAKCLIDCKTCPCDEADKTRQQQYPRVVRADTGTFYMVFEHDAETWITSSKDGLDWQTPVGVAGTGMWNGYCYTAMKIGPHPFFETDKDGCMAGGPPGITIVSNTHLAVFVGFGQNPGHMGCLQTSGMTITGFSRCWPSYLFAGAPTYGSLDVGGGQDANPYFDFRYITSADVLRVGNYYYMSYEGVRGPNATATRDNQFGLGFARSRIINTTWEEYSDNPVLMDVADNWGVGHADLLIVDGVTTMYTATPDLTRGRYVLVWK